MLAYLLMHMQQKPDFILQVVEALHIYQIVWHFEFQRQVIADVRHLFNHYGWKIHLPIFKTTMIVESMSMAC